MLGGVGDHGFGGESSEDEAFEQRVGREAIGAVDSGASGLASGVEAGYGGVAVNVCEDASHEVVRGGTDRDEVAVELEAVLGEEA